MKRKQLTATVLLSLAMVVCMVPSTSALTWHPVVEQDNWMKYKLSVSFDALFLFSFAYNGEYLVTIDSVSSDEVNITSEEISSNIPFDLSSLFDDLPFFFAPQEVLQNSSFNLSGIIIPTTVNTESDPNKFWRGIPVKNIDFVESNVASLFGNGSASSVFNIHSALMKYDNDTGLLYQLHFDATLDFIGVGFNVKMDISMVDASDEIKEVMNDNFVESFRTQFALYDFVVSPLTWSLIGVVVISLLMILVIMQRGKKKGQVRSVTSSKKPMTKKQRTKKKLEQRSKGRKPKA